MLFIINTKRRKQTDRMQSMSQVEGDQNRKNYHLLCRCELRTLVNNRPCYNLDLFCQNLWK